MDWKGKLEWTDEQIHSLERAVVDVLLEEGKPFTEEINLLHFWSGEELSLQEVLDQVEYATAGVEEEGREWVKLTSEEKEKIKFRLS